MTEQCCNLFSRRDVPKTRGLVEASREHLSTIGTECDGPNLAIVTEGRRGPLSRCRVPKLRGAVRASGQSELAVWTECNGGNRCPEGVFEGVADRVSGIGVPYPRGVPLSSRDD